MYYIEHLNSATQSKKMGTNEERLEKLIQVSDEFKTFMEWIKHYREGTMAKKDCIEYLEQLHETMNVYLTNTIMEFVNEQYFPILHDYERTRNLRRDFPFQS